VLFFILEICQSFICETKVLSTNKKVKLTNENMILYTRREKVLQKSVFYCVNLYRFNIMVSPVILINKSLKETTV
jgi:hypothetical protein